MSLANTSGFHLTDKTGPSTESKYPLIKRDIPVSSSSRVLERRKKLRKKISTQQTTFDWSYQLG